MICGRCAERDRERRAAGGRTAALLLRVWFEEGGAQPRARLLTATGSDPQTVATAQGVDDICTAVRTWLTRQSA